jgi:hypothetical protein
MPWCGGPNASSPVSQVTSDGQKITKETGFRRPATPKRAFLPASQASDTYTTASAIASVRAVATLCGTTWPRCQR